MGEHQNSQAVPSFNGTEVYIYNGYRHIPNMILKDTASGAFYLSSCSQNYFVLKTLEENSGMGKLVEALILISRDTTRVLSTKAQLF